MDSSEWLVKLISYDTTSRNSNLNLIDFIQKWLAQYPPIITRLTFDETQQKANLFATIPAANGNVNQDGYIFSGHTDVVPVDGQEWATDPFCGTIKDDRIYGRGACDMKGFIAVVLSLVPEFLKYPLKRPIHFAFSYDEEVGCLGVPSLIQDLQEQGVKPAACIVGEPTDMHIVVANKGISAFRCCVHGRAAHSSLTPEGCNAIEHASHLISWIRRLADQFKQLGPFDNKFDVAFSTMTTNQIHGGIALNIIPDTCEFKFELRNLPKVDSEQIFLQIQTYIQENLLVKMQKEFPDAAIEFTKLCGVPGFISSMPPSFMRMIQNITEQKEKRKVSYATEAGIFQNAGIPTIICGPGNIGQAHRPNEFVTLEQMALCEKVMRGLVILPPS